MQNQFTGWTDVACQLAFIHGPIFSKHLNTFGKKNHSIMEARPTASKLSPLASQKFTSLEISSPGAPRVHPRFFRVTLG